MEVDGTLYLEEHTTDQKLAEKYVEDKGYPNYLILRIQGRHESSSPDANVLRLRL